MNRSIYRSAKDSSAYNKLVSSKRRLCFWFTGITAAVYFLFIFSVALSPATLAKPAYQGSTMSAGVVVGVAIILLAIGLTGIYVFRTNRVFDPLTARLLREFEKDN